MAYAAVITTVAEMQFYAGENVDATGDVDANHTILQDQAEAYLSALIQDDVATNIGTYDATTKQILSEWASRFAAIGLISYNMDAYTSRIEAEDMINIHLFRMKQIENLLTKGEVLKQLGAS